MIEIIDDPGIFIRFEVTHCGCTKWSLSLGYRNKGKIRLCILRVIAYQPTVRAQFPAKQDQPCVMAR